MFTLRNLFFRFSSRVTGENPDFHTFFLVFNSRPLNAIFPVFSRFSPRILDFGRWLQNIFFSPYTDKTFGKIRVPLLVVDLEIWCQIKYYVTLVKRPEVFLAQASLENKETNI